MTRPIQAGDTVQMPGSPMTFAVLDRHGDRLLLQTSSGTRIQARADSVEHARLEDQRHAG